MFIKLVKDLKVISLVDKIINFLNLTVCLKEKCRLLDNCQLLKNFYYWLILPCDLGDGRDYMRLKSAGFHYFIFCIRSILLPSRSYINIPRVWLVRQPAMSFEPAVRSLWGETEGFLWQDKTALQEA